MEIPRLAIVGIEGLPQKFYLNIIPATIMIVAGMKRLMEVAYKVDEVLEGFLTPTNMGSRIRQDMTKAFNLTDRVNPITRNTTFGPGSYPANPLSTFNDVTAVGDPRTLQFGVRYTF